MKLATIAFLFLLLSCNNNDNADTKTVNTETTTSTDDDDKPGGDIESEKELLNKQSLACIALMNKLETEQNAAYAAGDAETARAIKMRIDSAARENVKIGQKLMALEK
jgi:hypothetical protein